MSSWNLNRVIVMLGGLATALAVLVFVGLARSPPQEAAPLALGILGVVVLAFWAPAWMYLVAALLLAAFPILIIFVFGASAAITHPGSGLEGYGLTLLLLGALLGLVGGITGFIQARRNSAPGPKSFGAPQGLVAIGIAALFLGLLVSSAWAGASLRDLSERPATHLASVDKTIHVTTDGHAWGPRTINLPLNQTVALHVTNGDPVVHTFTYRLEGALHDAFIPGQGTTDVILKFDKPQKIHFWCAPHSSETDTTETGMWGDLVVA